MSSDQTTQLEDIAAQVLALASKKGADAADVVVFGKLSNSASVRDGKIEDVERSEGCDLGLRVFSGTRQAIVSASRFTPDDLETLAERAVQMARVAPEDKDAGLADPALLAKSFAGLDLDDQQDLSSAQLLDMAREAEAAALNVKGVEKSAGSGAAASRIQVHLATSSGFAGSYARTGYDIGLSVIAGSGTSMQTDYDFTRAVHRADLRDPRAVGRRAGERTVEKLNPRKIASCRLPVFYDQRISASLLGHLAGAINGAGVARGTSFLKDAMGTMVFAPGITITDDPGRARGHGSKPFDAEGVGASAMDMVAGGALQHWFLDSYSARQLGLASNGRASRSVAGPPSPSPSNLYMHPGTDSPQDMIAAMGSGLYITSLIGMGVNPVTGDYSRGASGFYVENGEVTYPVSEITIASNLKDMFANATPAGDLEFTGSVSAPGVLIAEMTIAGV